MKKILSYVWKLPLCGIGFIMGLSLGGLALGALGFQSPDLPAGTDANTIAAHFLLGSLLLAFVLSFLSHQLACRWTARWLILSGLVWGIGGVGMVLESSIFMTTGAVSSLASSLYTGLNFLLPSLALSALTAAFFPPEGSQAKPFPALRQILGSHGWGAWLGKGMAVLLAYPLIYFLFGLAARPFIQAFYLTGQFELVNPTWGQMIPIQLVRSVLFLLVSLPVLLCWGGSRKGLWLALGSSLFLLTAFMAVLTSYWFPWQLRLYQGLELLGDALVYSAVLVGVLKEKPSAE